MTTIIYYPPFEDADSLARQMARAIWYLAPLDPSHVRMQSTVDSDIAAPPGYEAQICRAMAKRPQWLEVSPQAVTLKDLQRADIVVLWRGSNGLSNLGSNAATALKRAGVRVYDVDEASPAEGSTYVDISHREGMADDAVIAASSERFAELADRLAHLDTSHILCSGPQISRYAEYNFDDALNIICNSVINDEQLMQAVRPQLQVFGDPIFHFGCSEYADAFRTKLAEQQARYDFRCVIPLKYYNLFTHWQPALAEATIALPYSADLPINLDLRKRFEVRTTQNILTFLMLPVATTLSRRVRLLGCDGRPLGESDYFWSHNASTQFVDHMSNIRAVHPSFFEIDYDDYYLRHCSNVESYVQAGEAAGCTYEVLTASHIPALQQREIFKRTDASENRLNYMSLSTPPDETLDQSLAEADAAYAAAQARLEQQADNQKTSQRAAANEQRLQMLEQALRQLQGELEQLHSENNSLRGELSELRGALTTTEARTDTLTEESRQIAAVATSARQTARSLTALLRRDYRYRSNEPDFQSFPRFLDAQEIEQFVALAQSAFGLELEKRTIAYLAHHVRQIEASCAGRLATSIHAALTRVLSVLSLGQQTLEYLEIGVLFGVNTAIVWDLLRHHFRSTRITCIDPLEGYYDAKSLDALTGLPISEQLLLHNLHKVQCDMTQVQVLRGLSEDPQILEQASQRSYNYLLIDGDHSYDGVRQDFENYAPLVRSGGIVVIDDYGVEEWQEVTDYADRHVVTSPDYDVLNNTHRTLVLRKR